jgi:transmembrane sensor
MSAPLDQRDSNRARSAGDSAPGTGRTSLDWARETGGSEQVMASLARHLRRRRQVRASLAAGAVGLILLAGVLWQPWRRDVGDVGARPAGSVVVHRPRSQTLPDGSIADLNAGAALVVNYSASTRRVVLSGGEAHFQVNRDTARPFVVTSGAIDVRAVGTAFAVRPERETIAVLVTNGRVTVARADRTPPAASAGTPPPPLAVVEAGQGVRVAPEGAAGPPVQSVPAPEIARLLAWRVPRIEFSDTPIAQAVALFHAQGAERIRLADPSLGTLRVSGVLRADDPESLVRLLEAEYGLRTDRRDGAWVLQRR